MLIDSYDAALFDLDGVVYVGPHAVPGAPEAIAELRRSHKLVAFVTNNAARRPKAVAEHLRELGIDLHDHDVVTSAQAASRMLAEDLAPGSPVFVVGTPDLRAEVAEAGLLPVEADATVAPAAVIVGYNHNLSWPDLEEACIAIQRGAAYYACNPDLTRPTERGVVPGMGALIHAISLAVPGVEPKIAGKPYRPLLDETLRRIGAKHPLFVGDRLDTDVRGAFNAGMDSFLVFTGAHGKEALLTAVPEERPTLIGWDVSALLRPPRVSEVEAGVSRCGMQVATFQAGKLTLTTAPAGREEQLDALWAAVTLAWETGADARGVLGDLDLVP